MSLEAESWWVVCVRDWGSVAILGSEKQAEDFRVHKARWEYCPAWKLCVREATPVEVDEFGCFRDSESGIVRDERITLPADVRALIEMEAVDFIFAVREDRDLRAAKAAPPIWPTLALTLIQPWGSLIISFGKDIENRTWSPGSRLNPGDRLWIHAGKKLDEEVETWAALEVPGYDDAWGDTPAPTGKLLGHVRYDGAAGFSRSPWFVGPIGWRLSDPVALARPIPCKGAQGLWRVPADVLKSARLDLEGRAA